MATGERSFSTAEAVKTKRNFTPVKEGDYELKLLGDVAEIRTALPSKNQKTGKMSQPKPRVGLRFEALNSAEEEGGRNKLVFHDLSCDMTPNKAGEVAPTGADQLKGLSDALGAEGDFPFIMYLPKGATEKVKILDPRAVLAYIKEHNGEVVSAHVKVQAGSKDYPEAKNKITEFFEPGGGEVASDEGIPDTEEEIPSGDDETLEELPDLKEVKNPPKKKAAPVLVKKKR